MFTSTASISKNAFDCVVIRDSNNKVYKIMQPAATMLLTTDYKGIFVRDLTGVEHTFFVGSSKKEPLKYRVKGQVSYSVLSGGVQQLFDLLRTEFFNSAFGGGGGPVVPVNMYTTDGTITDQNRQIQGNGGNSIIFNNFDSITLDSAEGSQIEVATDIAITSVDTINMVVYAGFSYVRGLQKIIVSLTEPPAIYQTREFLFYSPLDKTFYYWDEDVSLWLSVDQHNMNFGERGNTPNNAFFRTENVNTSVNNGKPVGRKMVITGLDYNNPTLAGDQDINIFVDNLPESTVRLSLERQGYEPLNNKLVVDAGKRIAVNKNGSTNNNMLVALWYRLAHIEFILYSVRIYPSGVGSNYIVAVKFGGSFTAFIFSVEIQFNEPFTGPDPVQDPIILSQTKPGLLEFPTQTFDGNPQGEEYELTLTFFGPNGLFQRNVTVTVE